MPKRYKIVLSEEEKQKLSRVRTSGTGGRKKQDVTPGQKSD